MTTAVEVNLDTVDELHALLFERTDTQLQGVVTLSHLILQLLLGAETQLKVPAEKTLEALQQLQRQMLTTLKTESKNAPFN